MDVAIVGGGPTGLVLSAALARRGDRVVVVERDPGPGTDGRWPRRGVMQFHHAHVVRAQVTWTLQRELPEAYERWIEAGAEEVYLKREDGSPILAGTRSRRATLERAAALVPGLREWTDPERSAPITAVLAGGQLRNHYRSQHDAEDRPRLGRFVSVGDAICTTTPVFGRGLPLAMMQIDRLIPLAAEQAPHISAGAFGYRSMTAGPGSLRRFEADARDVYRTGWRPAMGDGPSSRELAEAIGSPVRTGDAR